MASQTNRNGESDADGESVEWRDAAEKSSGALGGLLDGLRNGRSDRTPKGAGGAEGSNAGAARSDGARALVRSILDGLREPTVVVGVDGRITHLNAQALALYDCTEAEAVGAAPRSLRDGDATDVVAEAIRDGEDVRQREETVVVDGRETPLERTVTLLYDGDGGFDGAMLVATDVTERRREEAKAAYLERYQRAVLDDLQDKLARLADGDLTIDPTVSPPTEEYEEATEVNEEFTELNASLETAIDNIHEVVAALTEDADALNDAGTSLSANTEEVTASIQEIDASSTELGRGADDLAEDTQQASHNVDELSASIEEITASIQQISAGVDEQSTAMEEVAASAQHLSAMSDEFHARVDAFKLDADESADLDDAAAAVGR